MFFIDSKKGMNYFRFPVDEDNIDGNISIQSVDSDEDDLLDDEEQQVDQSDDNETQENNDLHSSHLDQIQLTMSTVTMVHKTTIQAIRDEFLGDDDNDDDEPVMIQPETRLIILNGFFECTSNLLNRCQAFVSMEIGKKDVVLH